MTTPWAVPASVLLAQLEEIEVRVERLVAGGEGLARFQGIPIFVPRSAPGDLLLVRLVERRPDFGRAEIVRILEPGSGRREAPCPYFARCGGCDLQHLEDGLQSRLKAQAALETLQRLGGISPPADLTVLTAESWGYRLRTRLHVEPGAPARVGYLARGSHDLVAVDRCPILVPQLEEALPRLPAALAGQTGKRLDLAAGDGGTWTAAPLVAGLPHGEVTTQVGEFSYAYDARSFFQGHQGLLAPLAEAVVGKWTGERAFDLYCGAGLFTLPLARRYRAVVGVEGDAGALRYLRANAKRNKLDNIEAVGRALEVWIRELPPGAERVVVDPPRAGLANSVRRVLADRLPRRLTYVSCHAATLARDLRELAPLYSLDALTLVDLFPQTGHLEAVAQLSAREAP
jgi:23S rRNA (uracil1939-C5)-methyltransferase